MNELKWLAFEVTPKCNLNCIHCRTNANANLNEVLTYKQITQTIEDIDRRYKPVLVLTGGEPLLRSDIFEIAAFAKSKNWRVGLATNGTLVDEKLSLKIKAHFDIVSLSLDGSTAQIHDNFRAQEGAFDATINAAKLLAKHDIPFIINSSFTKRNQHDIENTYKLAKSLGAKSWYMFIIVPTGRGENLQSELISKNDYYKILKWHFKLELQEKTMFIRPTCAPEYYAIVDLYTKTHNVEYIRRSLSFSTGGAKGCIAGQSIAFIAFDGSVKPCSYFLRSAGNIIQNSFLDIWDNSPIFQNLRDFSNYTGKCKTCDYISMCGGCRARADAYFGDYLAIDPYCLFWSKNAGK
ncbi:radical SAM/SPASM domain-containing protein [Desulfurella multipotens]|uniref:radical SAM/SPASM domain-containing protein n=1 Tax=Desulfurella multipotens TaxID=79269 RepID=UPI000CBA3E40|nr:radical SAM protein [Desulfurella multipotens]PMP68956.1 MAG: radical SAM/SPASM domain-containing protein [Desulfurella multipotens]